MIAYYAVICTILTGFSVYDIKTQRVPDKALAAFSPIILLGPFLSGMKSPVPALIQSLSGAVYGFGVLLAAGVISKDGAGIGGGDIKLAGLIGFAFGPYRIMVILLLATLLAMPAGLAYMRIKKSKASLHMAFVPFMTAGSLIVTVTRLFT